MQPKTANDLAKLTKEEIGELYFRSLQDTHSRKNHVLLMGTPNPPTPKTIENDCTVWYAGFMAFGAWIDSTVELPTVPEVVGYIAKNFDRAKAAIAA